MAADSALSAALRARAAAGLPTVLTPHPLEAARLLAINSPAVQADRIGAARRLAGRTRCTVVLKGSGSVIAAPDGALWINPTGNARLGSAGTGDVLAGWLGGLWSQHAASTGLEAAIASVWLHGHAAEGDDLRGPLRAADLVEVMAANLP